MRFVELRVLDGLGCGSGEGELRSSGVLMYTTKHDKDLGRKADFGWIKTSSGIRCPGTLANVQNTVDSILRPSPDFQSKSAVGTFSKCTWSTPRAHSTPLPTTRESNRALIQVFSLPCP